MWQIAVLCVAVLEHFQSQMNLTNFTGSINQTVLPPVTETFNLLPAYLPQTSRYVLTSLLLMTILVAFFGNLVVCWIVYRKPAMRSAINLLLAHLALSDILLSLFSTPLPVVGFLSGAWEFGNTVCIVSGFLHNALNYVGIYILLIISLDRYLIIVQHKEMLTVQRAKVLIFISWVLSCALSFPPILGWSSYELVSGLQCMVGKSKDAASTVYILIVTVLTTFLPLLLMLHAFLGIMLTVRKRRVRVQDEPREVNISYNKKVVSATISASRRVAVDMGFKTRSYQTITLLFLVLLVCWTPFTLMLMVRSILRQKSGLTTVLLLCFCCLKTAVNPVIYCVRIKKFREACSGILPVQRWSIPKSVTRRVNPTAAYEVRQQSSV